MPDLDQDAQDAYEAAEERARTLRSAWDELGFPVLTEGSKKQPIAHPLLRAMNEAELVALRLREPLGKKHREPDPKAFLTMQPRITKRRSL